MSHRPDDDQLWAPMLRASRRCEDLRRDPRTTPLHLGRAQAEVAARAAVARRGRDSRQFGHLSAKPAKLLAALHQAIAETERSIASSIEHRAWIEHKRDEGDELTPADFTLLLEHHDLELHGLRARLARQVAQLANPLRLWRDPRLCRATLGIERSVAASTVRPRRVGVVRAGRHAARRRRSSAGSRSSAASGDSGDGEPGEPPPPDGQASGRIHGALT